MRAATLFSGCGGSDLGLEMAGIEVCYANDIDEHACDTYALNHPGRVDHRDIGDVTGADIGPVDLLVASPPCQPWSGVGKRLGAKDPRNKFDEYLRLLGEVPSLRATVWENVPNLASDHYFKWIVRRMKALGYSTAARKLNAADLGVAQDRERLIVIGIKGASDDAAGRAFPRAIAPRLCVADVCPDIVRVEGHEYYKAVYRPASRPFPTITASERPHQVRRRDGSLSKPTIPELLALSSFPRDFKFPDGSSDADCRARIGNAVPPLMMFHVARKLRDVLREAGGAAAVAREAPQ